MTVKIIVTEGLQKKYIRGTYCPWTPNLFSEQILQEFKASMTID
jgi:hypothetical protein